ncbi:MAG: hypothetical protein COV08_02580 [Candidatus Vogelbacteria bacterium CG10_big_fil_rev_8_21_14_0_10_49_38]|uniref:Uncharacterized protein n=1 Tax=Candidatus Vogelbacteria bacterium CG10_big_fil_rev_8_21_14_0_10_49_38 TaxID=1975043 RepID=A0A2H0RJE1_9BACT|nr:MAG: hypothetical protein BK006_02595 [bacterium CG10_49_38]PIR45895.1 MAG: hypothetical protein COV08_02580 [Candidatus Vogelbacteria bacterium CG10_big_fil_rev_8_21_14_0_10_49_38]
MNEDGINRQWWFAISLGLVFMFSFIFILIGGSDELPTNTPAPARPSDNQTTSPKTGQNQPALNHKTEDLNLIQNLIQQGLPPEKQTKPEIISERKGILNTLTAALSQTAETIIDLTKATVFKILPGDEPNPPIDEAPPNESSLPNSSSNGSDPTDLIEEEPVFDPSKPKLIEGANPLLVD